MSTTWNSQIGRELRRQRERDGLSFNSLSDKTRDLQRPVHRVAIPKIEAGERDVTVAELVGLASALALPPLHLLFPDIRQDVELFPGNPVPGARALGWFTGTGDDADQNASTMQLALAIVSNEIALNTQRHNLIQAEQALLLEGSGTISMVPGMREHEEENVAHTRRQIDRLEARQKDLLHTYARLVDGDFDA